MKKLLYSSLAIAALAVSCQEAELENNNTANNGEVFRISAALPETKTTLNPDDYTVAWESSDELTVIVNSNTAYKFTNAGGDNFEATGVALEDGTNTFHVLYPYSEFVYSVDENGVTCGRYGSKTYVSIPSEASEKQVGLDNVDHVKGVMHGYATVSSSEDTPSITMHQLTSLLKIDVTNSYGEAIDVKSVTVSTDAEGELLSGTFYVNLEDGTVESSGADYTHDYTTLEVTDGQIPAGETATFWVSANPFKVPAGAKLVISVNAEQGVVTDERTYEQELVFEAGTVNKTTFDYTTPSGIEKLTVAEFLAKPTGATYYELTGTISDITNTDYGNFNLTDGTGTVYVYGLTASMVTENDKSFASLGLREGDILTLCGTRAEYKGDAQVGGPAYYISHVAVPYCDVTPSTLSVDAAEGTTTFAIESNESWEITSSNTSYTVSPESGEGDKEITVTYPANETDEAITVTFTVKSESGEKTVTLTQASVSATSVELLNETFTGLVGNNTDSNGANTSWNGNDNFPKVTKAYQAGDAVKIGASKNPSQGSITSKELTVPANSILTVSFDVKGWSSVEGDIEVTFNGETHAVEYTATMSGSFENKTTTFNVSTETVSSVTIGTTAKRAYIDNVIISYSK